MTASTHFLQDILRRKAEMGRRVDDLIGPGQDELYQANLSSLVRSARHVFVTGIGASRNAAMSAGAVLQVAGRPSARGLFMNLGLNRVAARSIVIWVTAGFLVLLLFMGKLPAPSGLNELVISVGM